jgi:4-aminobutyrate aminotransferase-like enzyme
VRYSGDVFPNLFGSAKGTIVQDSHGRECLDFTSGQICATIGHNRPAIVAAVHRAGEKAFHFFSGMIPEVVDLALTPFDMQSAGRGAAIMDEPVISAGGLLVPPQSFRQLTTTAPADPSRSIPQHRCAGAPRRIDRP